MAERNVRRRLDTSTSSWQTSPAGHRVHVILLQQIIAKLRHVEAITRELGDHMAEMTSIHNNNVEELIALRSRKHDVHEALVDLRHNAWNAQEQLELVQAQPPAVQAEFLGVAQNDLAIAQQAYDAADREYLDLVSAVEAQMKTCRDSDDEMMIAVYQHDKSVELLNEVRQSYQDIRTLTTPHLPMGLASIQWALPD